MSHASTPQRPCRTNDDRAAAINIAEALTFQQAIPPIYQMVYPEAGKVNPSLQKSLNDFLLTWLRNCVAQGHRFGNPESGA